MRNFSCHIFKTLTTTHHFKHFQPFSTVITENPLPKTPFKVVDYLINACGLSKEKALSTSQHLTTLNSCENPDRVINFFKQTGFNQTQITTLISQRPVLLSSNVDNTLEPKIRVLQDLGFSGSALFETVVKSPSILMRSVNTHLLPTIDFLRSFLGTDENVIKVIRRSRWVLSSDIRKLMIPNISYLRQCGVPERRIIKFIVNNPYYVLQKPSWLVELGERVEGKFGIKRESGMFIYAIDAIGSMTESTLESKIRVFESFGWSESVIVTMVRNLPYCMAVSERKIRKGLDYFIRELKFKPEDIARQPKLLMYSLEKRIVPRNVVLELLKSKGLLKKKKSLFRILCLPEDQFFKEYVIKYIDEDPNIYEAYVGIGSQNSAT